MIKNLTEFNKPTIFCIFGATGSLSKTKLIPALCSLHDKGYLPDEYHILGFSKDEMDDSEFQDLIRESAVSKGGSLSEEDIEDLVEGAKFVSGDFNKLEDYESLKEEVEEIDDGIGVCANKLYYLAAPQSFYETIFNNLSESGLMDPCSEEEGWARILVEKPFGSDLKKAKELDRLLDDLFKEEQIFRIDHYLSKSAIQNILAFRFSNKIFGPLWDKDGIEKVEVKMLEDYGVEDRGEFYDAAGALRDVGQNHILQMMAMVGMENPGGMEFDAIREARADFFEDLKPIDEDDLESDVVLGQYEGYRDIDGVDPDSDMETYFKVKAFVGSDRWEGVPFYLESGKKLDKTRAEISIHFDPCMDCLCPPEAKCGGHRNVLTFSIKPEQTIDVTFWAKKPGFSMELEPKTLSFSLESGWPGESPTAYESVLFNAVVGDQTLFVSSREVEETWEFIMSILDNRDKLDLKTYEPGSKGPEGF